jgi:hypothetical protein
MSRSPEAPFVRSMRIKITAAAVAALVIGLSVLGLANPVQPGGLGNTPGSARVQAPLATGHGSEGPQASGAPSLEYRDAYGDEDDESESGGAYGGDDGGYESE